MNRILPGACLLAAATAALAVAPERPAPPYREGEVLVKYRGHAASDAAERLRRALGLVSRRLLLDGRAELVALPSVLTTAGALRILRQDPAVEFAEPNFRRYSRAIVPNDPLFGDQWGLRNTGQPNFVPGGPAGVAGGDLNMINAWDADGDGAADRTGDPGVIVAIVDDAVEVSHPDLAPNVLPGRNFVSGQDPNNPAPLCAEEGHGTRVAGCVGARGNNGVGVAGVAWAARLLPLKFGFDVASHIQALAYARDHGANIVNASFGGPGFSPMEREAIADLANYDILYVAAAGNDDSNTDVAQLNYPANYDAENIVAVAATNRQDNIASFSQYGPLTTDVAAPGLQIVTTAVSQTYSFNPGTAGTSFASPYAAGVAALVKSHPQPGEDARDFREIKARLIESGTAVSGANPEQRTTGGRIDADRALDMADGPSLVLRAVNVSGGDGNGALDPGETLAVAFTVQNLWQDATGVTASLAASDTAVTVNTAGVDLGSVPAQGEAVAAFEVTVDAGVADHRYVIFTLTLGADGGYGATRSYIAEIGDLVPGTPVAQPFTDDLYDEFHAWHVDVPATLQPGTTLVVRTSTSGGADVDLLAKFGTPPQYSITVGINPEIDFGFFCTSGTEDSCQDPNTLVSGRLDGTEAITVVNPVAGGTYHLVVVNFVQQAVAYDLSAALLPGDLRPEPFDFADRNGVGPNAVITSNAVTVTGIDAATFITIVGGDYSINGAPFTAAEGVVQPNESVRVRANSGPAAFARAQVTIGGVTDTFYLNPPGAIPFPGAFCPPPPSGGGGGGAPAPLLLALLLLATARRQARA
jgi:hypothetical protein